MPCAISNQGGKGTLYDDDDDAPLLCAPTTSLISRTCASPIKAHYIVGLVSVKPAPIDVREYVRLHLLPTTVSY